MRRNAQNLFIRRSKRGYCIRPESARSLLHAERFARNAGLPLNVLVTIIFRKEFYQVRSKKGTASKAKSYYDIFRKHIWLNTRRRWNSIQAKRTRPEPFMAVAVFENPLQNQKATRKDFGPVHVHWLLRWDLGQINSLERFIWKQMQKNLLSYATSKPLKRMQKQIEPICQKNHLKVQEAYSSSGAARYMAKGIDKAFAEHFYIKHQPQGPIKHRRIITSISIGPSQRKKSGKLWKKYHPNNIQALRKIIYSKASYNTCKIANKTKIT